MWILSVVPQVLMITAFVAVMMILVEYLNVLTRGSWERALSGSRWVQLVIAVLLGATPGCLGAFVVVALYTHRLVSLGAVVACMVATSGDEAFVMLALFPAKAVLIMLGIAFVGLVAGVTTDLTLGRQKPDSRMHGLILHESERDCRCFSRERILEQLRRVSMARVLMVLGLGAFVAAIVLGQVGPPAWNWIRATLLLTGLLALFIVMTVPDHFLNEHLWRHVTLQHVPRIFAWTLAAMLVIAVLERWVELDAFVGSRPWVMLGAAGLLGIVPESGPHLLFVTLYDHGSAPLGVLVASSVVQDGHGMLPLLAHSRKQFMKVKAINLIAGILVGALLLALGRLT